MCGGYRGPQIGAPLEKQDLAAMPPEVQALWCSFFDQADKEIGAAKSRGERQPYAPSHELREKHTRLVTGHNGGIYCPMRQLETIFDFSPPN